MYTKTYIIILLLIKITSFAQNKTDTLSTTKKEIQEIKKKKYPEYVLLSDLTKSDKGINAIDKSVKMINGKNQDVNVKFSVNFYDYEPNESDLAKININTDQTIWLAKFNLKNKSSFEPFDILVTKAKSSWTIYLKYTAKNDLGVEKEGIKIYKYDLTGKQIN